ncbi:hypothetical protein TVAG_362550 [Trichomonas vaginalis G3]|uniref:Uncharacterized protein n=1 Tax=Trichomonas vaginalis (strain ATCC PRA-98 / G3) TaxID=412133 RepID=A2E633_TRIV3|nr:hypothetical protein TVAGG3_0366150 [Trichomonas vaginalis G3]EAY11875.1 hypothetical protein TVAG_362550 [Trichomonas vaginalis G3]KAI5532286.1 hypothetical protein TVAGG3_0366150 [Trichomonas vaginalis G3]|eukprot:XP_001324098.1 hypothetical protein [Trichomonas vaginalis G3]
MFFAITSLGISKILPFKTLHGPRYFPKHGPFVPLLPGYEKIGQYIPPSYRIAEKNGPYFQEDENGWLKKLAKRIGVGATIGLPFQETEENGMMLDLYKSILKQEILKALYGQEAEENGIRFPGPRPTRPDPIFPGPIYIQKAEKNAFRPIPMHPPPYFQEDENGWFKKLAKRVGVGAAIKILLQEAEENGPFEPIPIHPPPHFQEDENGWLKKLAKRVGVGAAMKILLQEAEENSKWTRFRDRHLKPAIISILQRNEDEDENSLWTKIRDGVIKPAVIKAILLQEQEENFRQHKEPIKANQMEITPPERPYPITLKPVAPGIMIGI